MSRNAIDYEIATAHNEWRLVERVRSMIGDGWQPLGGPHKSPLGYSQAMVKYEVKK